MAQVQIQVSPTCQDTRLLHLKGPVGPPFHSYSHPFSPNVPLTLATTNVSSVCALVSSRMLCEWNQLCVIFWGFFPTQHNSIEICPCCCVSQFVPLLLTTVQQWMCHTELRFLCSQFVKFFLSRLLVFGAIVTRAFWSPSYKNYLMFCFTICGFIFFIFTPSFQLESTTV